MDNSNKSRRYLSRVLVLYVWLAVFAVIVVIAAAIIFILDMIFPEKVSLIIYICLIPLLLPLAMAGLSRIKILRRLSEML